jgi:DNA-binding GntR family transcriptional regulator
MDNLELYLKRHNNHTAADPTRLLSDIAYERLKDAIRHADMQPGEPLSETRLSTILGISRTPVREALRQLAQEGLVHIIPGRAITIASRSIRDVLNIVHMRSLLEPELARLVAESISPRQLEELCQAMDEMETAVHNNNQEAWSIADTKYHETLNKACPNELLGEMTTQMRNRVHYLANVDSQTNPERLEACTIEHREIVDAIAAHDGTLAEKAVRRHIEELRQSLFNRLNYS